MPELPDVTIYVESLQRHIGGLPIREVHVRSPFSVRSFEYGIADIQSRTIQSIRRMGKRIIWELNNDLFVVIHLMIAGRFHWRKPDVRPTRRVDLASFNFETGTLLLTEASSKKRASLHVVRGLAALEEFRRDGIEVTSILVEEFAEVLRRENRTLKRALTDPRYFSGIGNAYSDEILHRAGLSPFLHSQKLSDEQVQSLFDAATHVLDTWTQRLRAEVGDKFPEKVTAFRKEMAVHGKFGEPCPVCSAPVQRVVYAENEMNYCPGCQTDGKILADRSLSRLMKDDWPRTLEELED